MANPVGRRCGTCSACCRWPAVPEIDKPPRVACPHLEKQGFRCTIYEDRPKMCAEYRCSWLRGLGADKDRPDTCGMLIDRRMTKWGYVLVAKQLEPGSAATQRGKNAITRAAKDGGMLCLVVDFDDTDKVIGAGGDKPMVQQFEKETKGIPVRLGRVSEYVERLVEKATEGIWPGM